MMVTVRRQPSRARPAGPAARRRAGSTPGARLPGPGAAGPGAWARGRLGITNENRKAAPRLRPFGAGPTNEPHTRASSLARLSDGNWLQVGSPRLYQLAAAGSSLPAASSYRLEPTVTAFAYTSARAGTAG